MQTSMLLNPDISKTPGDNGFKFEIENLKDKNRYMPEKIYKGW